MLGGQPLCLDNKDVTPKKVAIYLENVLRFVDLDAEIPIDGDPDICVKQKSENAYGGFNEYRKRLWLQRY